MGQETNEAKKGLFCGSLRRKKALEPRIAQAQNMCTVQEVCYYTTLETRELAWGERLYSKA